MYDVSSVRRCLESDPGCQQHLHWRQDIESLTGDDEILQPLHEKPILPQKRLHVPSRTRWEENVKLNLLLMASMKSTLISCEVHGPCALLLKFCCIQLVYHYWLSELRSRFLPENCIFHFRGWTREFYQGADAAGETHGVREGASRRDAEFSVPAARLPWAPGSRAPEPEIPHVEVFGIRIVFT